VCERVIRGPVISGPRTTKTPHRQAFRQRESIPSEPASDWFHAKLPNQRRDRALLSRPGHAPGAARQSVARAACKDVRTDCHGYLPMLLCVHTLHAVALTWLWRQVERVYGHTLHDRVFVVIIRSSRNATVLTWRRAFQHNPALPRIAAARTDHKRRNWFRVPDGPIPALDGVAA